MKMTNVNKAIQSYQISKSTEKPQKENVQKFNVLSEIKGDTITLNNKTNPNLVVDNLINEISYDLNHADNSSRIDELRNQILNNTYKVDSKQIAKAMFNGVGL